MPPKYVIIWKDIGQTPLECLEKLKISHIEWAHLPMTYAGRLDPMAEGLLIILIGDECKNKDKYLKLDKTYEFQVLVEFSTDTYDLLGVLTPSEEVFPEVLGSPLQGQKDEKAQPDRQENLSSDFVDLLQSFVGTFMQKYPSFSSKTVEGKQLWELSKDDELPDELPEHEVTIHSLEVTKEEKISKYDLQKEISRRIALVKGDFRQKDILEAWYKVFDHSKQEEYKIFSLICDCSSGTYIRQLVSDMGGKLGVPMVTYSIKRTRIGDYNLHDIHTK
jgi:tRNA pseudouridine55 synthase